MTIKERFAKFTDDELIKGIADLEAKIAKDKNYMAEFRASSNVEMFKMAERNYNDDCAVLLDVRCALAERQ